MIAAHTIGSRYRTIAEGYLPIDEKPNDDPRPSRISTMAYAGERT